MRITPPLKGLTRDHIPVHLVKGGQMSEDCGAVTPTALVPRLVTDEGQALVLMCPYLAMMPPSIGMVVPVMKLDAGEQSSRTRPLSSSGWAMRPRGTMEANSASTSG